MPPYSVPFSLQGIPDLSGKVIIITGGATGIGKETAIECFRRNAKVYIASRSRAKFDALTRELETSSVRSGNDLIPSGSLEFLPLDLMDVKDCIRAAKEFVSTEQRLDVVIANAALAVAPCVLSKDGIEVQFATNHLGHFVFIYNLLDTIKTTSVQFGEARIVVVASHAHAMYRPSHPNIISFGDLEKEGSKKLESLQDVQAGLQRYARSKLANILFARSLFSSLQKSGYSNIFVNALNPGTIGTSSDTESAALPPWLAFVTSSLVRLVSIPPASGALTSLLLATSPEIPSNNLNGRYFDVGPLAGKLWYGYSWDATEVKLSAEAKNIHLAGQLWDWSLGIMTKAEQSINEHQKTTTSNVEQLDGNLALA